MASHSLYSLYSFSSPPRIALLTAGYKGLFYLYCQNKVNVVVVVVVVSHDILYDVMTFDFSNNSVRHRMLMVCH